MEMKHRYSVGGHSFVVDAPAELLPEKELAAYAPFRAAYCGEDDDLLFSLTVTDSTDALLQPGAPIARFDEDDGSSMELFAQPSGGIAVYLRAAGSECCRVSMEPGYRRATAWTGGSAGCRRYGLDTALMLLYAFASAPLDTVLVHASTVELDGRGYLFLGRSGTGKSTHSRLWLEHVPGARLLNDDNPVLRVVDGKAVVYGSPWSGKTPCYIARSLPVGAITRLHQAPHNRIARLRGVRAYAALHPSCSCMKWDPAMAAGVHRTVGLLTGVAPVYDLECLPDREAAMLCMDTVTRAEP